MAKSRRTTLHFQEHIDDGPAVAAEQIGGGWYDKDDAKKTITLYGGSGDYGEPKLSFLDRIPRELRDYKFFFTPIHGLPGNELDLSEVEWI